MSLIIMVGFAIGFIAIQEHHADFLSLCMGSMNYVNGGLIGVFTVFTFFPSRLTGISASAGLIAGFCTTTVCEWAFANPVPWTYTIVLSSTASFVAAFVFGRMRGGEKGAE